MVKDWDCVMVFDPEDTDQETSEKFSQYLFNNHSAVGDKNVPNAEATRKLLNRY